MKMPGADNAVVDVQKLRDYCLNLRHPRGRHKARVFAATLGLTPGDAGILREALLLAARRNEAMRGEVDGYGQRFVVEFSMDGPSGAVRVRSNWIIRAGESFPRLTSCYVA